MFRLYCGESVCRLWYWSTRQAHKWGVGVQLTSTSTIYSHDEGRECLAFESSSCEPERKGNPSLECFGYTEEQAACQSRKSLPKSDSVDHRERECSEPLGRLNDLKPDCFMHGIKFCWRECKVGFVCVRFSPTPESPYDTAPVWDRCDNQSLRLDIPGDSSEGRGCFSEMFDETSRPNHIEICSRGLRILKQIGLNKCRCESRTAQGVSRGFQTFGREVQAPYISIKVSGKVGKPARATATDFQNCTFLRNKLLEQPAIQPVLITAPRTQRARATVKSFPAFAPRILGNQVLVTHNAAKLIGLYPDMQAWCN